eukprot:7192693-Prymnesium_polylepis.1
MDSMFRLPADVRRQHSHCIARRLESTEMDFSVRYRALATLSGLDSPTTLAQHAAVIFQNLEGDDFQAELQEDIQEA